MTRNKITQWLWNNKIGLIIGFIFGAFIAPFLAVLGLQSVIFMNLRPLLIGPIDLIRIFIPLVQTGPHSYYVPTYAWVLTLGFNGICYAVLAGIVQSIITKNKVRKQEKGQQASDSLIALRQLQNTISREADKKGITEKDLLNDLETVREEMWNERKK